MPPCRTAFRAARALCIAAAAAPLALASSHREAPFVTKHPKIDATDFYLFRSYEPGREDTVTVVANYLPLQDPYGGPNYFTLDADALYEILIDNDGDAREDLTFQFRFQNTLADLALDIGPPGATKRVSVPVVNVGPIAPGMTDALNVVETYSVTLVRGDRRSGAATAVRNAAGGATVFTKPADNIGQKSIPDYAAYAASHVYSIDLGGGFTGRLFVGQRKDPFVVNLGETFDLVNYSNPLGPPDAQPDTLADKNVTSLVLELPIAFVTRNAETPVVAGWTAASLRQARVSNPAPTYAVPSVEGGAYVQQSRLANPLVNELVIGLKDKDRFNASHPSGDGQFADYVTNPTLPAIVELLFSDAGVRAPTVFPRTDLVAAFLTGVDGLNENGSTCEMMRLNTAIAPTPAAAQERLGVIADAPDLAGFPNGRRPGDDVVDIALRVAMGKLLPLADAPSGQLPFTDGAFVDASFFDAAFPYLRNPIPGSPNGASAKK